MKRETKSGVLILTKRHKICKFLSLLSSLVLFYQIEQTAWRLINLVQAIVCLRINKCISNTTLSRQFGDSYSSIASLICQEEQNDLPNFCLFFLIFSLFPKFFMKLFLLIPLFFQIFGKFFTVRVGGHSTPLDPWWLHHWTHEPKCYIAIVWPKPNRLYHTDWFI